MIVDAKEFKELKALKTQVCIIGSGAAGIPLALELANHYGDIVILESGSETLDAETQSLYSGVGTPEFYPDPISSRFRMLGGSCNFWHNNTSPLDPIDFEKRPWISNSGWPISYEDVLPYYERAENYCGTGGEGYESQFWVDRTGIPDLFSESNLLELSIAKAANPSTFFFRKYAQKLSASNKIRVVKNANFTDFLFNNNTGNAESIEFKTLTNPDVGHRLSAKIFILCMGGIENARMLLYVNRKNNNRLGNQGDNVGHYFMDHPVPRAAVLYPSENKNNADYRLFQGVEYPDKRIVSFLKLRYDQLVENETINLRMPLNSKTNYELSEGIRSYHILQQSIADGELHDAFGFHISNILDDLDMVGEAVSRRLLGHSIFSRAQDFAGFQIPVMMEQIPDFKNHISLSQSLDAFGIPKVEINWEITDENMKLFWKSLTLTARGLGEGSHGKLRLLRQFHERVWGTQMGLGNHHMGTTRMAATEKKGVVDSNQRVFGTSNIYVGGSSVFPTGGHVPPTLTIVALTIRLAKHLIKQGF